MLKKTLKKVAFYINRYLPKYLFGIGIRFWLTLICFVFIAKSIFDNLEKLSTSSLDFNSYLYLGLGFFFSWIGLVFNAIAWKFLIQWLGIDSKGKKLIKLFLVTNTLKYLPGGVWHFVARFRSLKKSVNSNKQAFLAITLEPFLMLSAALFVVPLGNLWNGLALIGLVPSILFLKPWRSYLLSKLEKLKLAQFSKIDDQFLVNTSYPDTTFGESIYPFKAFFIEIIFVIIRFMGFWCSLGSFSIESELGILKWLSIFSLSWSVGLVVPSAPGGIGIFEAFLILITPIEVSRAPLILALISYRLIVSLADIFAAISSSSRRFNFLRNFY